VHDERVSLNSIKHLLDRAKGDYKNSFLLSLSVSD
jgi:hypothetical protein